MAQFNQCYQTLYPVNPYLYYIEILSGGGEISVKQRLKELCKELNELRHRLEIVNAEILKLKTTCPDDSKTCEFIQRNASYICKICNKVIKHK